MAWTDPSQRSTGDLITNTIYNTDIIDNLDYLQAAIEVELTNKSGGSVAANDVVIADGSNDSAFTTTTTAENIAVIGVVMETIANDAIGRVATTGIVTVAVTGTITRGHYLSTSTTVKLAQGIANKTGGTFAIALTGGTGTVVAILLSSATGMVPANTVMYTTGGTAPAGFSEYTSARGRMIIGLPSGGTDEGTVGTALTDLQDKTHTHTYSTVISHTHTVARGQGTGGAASTATGADNNAYSDMNTGSTGSASGTTATAALSDFLAYIQLMTIKKD